ncbi:e9296dbe-47ba-4f12-8eaf-bb4b7521df1d-CDS [Sclerotinia trifoliorum]|uniref:E9296dbe-47ba-4f12-8eaf-bb4b7521df1d-CDS n=1 Tax=Sclerotinia trifoliorum TaxID=28548 RepID=A0A8H2W065_9HELO|nr:e9296dbe-47ba-4f12-8eaf-bb4b7521df1d-CDS [Sclerotinia trifoliorum]
MEEYCLAGIWEEHLPHALVWFADDEHGTGPLPLRGPSWSWASRNGSIRYDRIYSFVTTPYDDRPNPWAASDFKFLDIQVQATTPDSYGHCVGGGAMRIECVKLIDGTRVSDGVYPGRTSKTLHIGDESFSINYYFDDRRDHSKIFLPKIFTRIVQEHSEAFYQWTPEIQERPSPPSSHANGIHGCEEGLIVAPVIGRKGTFTLIGIYRIPG